MEAAATAAKIATTAAPAVVEGASIASTVTTAATTGAETLQAATATSEAVQGGAKAAEVGAGLAEATPEAAEAAADIDSALAEGAAAPEQAMRELVSSPVAKTEEVVQVTEVKGVATPEDVRLATQNQAEIQRAVQPQMAEWDKSNPSGDDIAGWIEQREAAEKQFTVNEGVNRDLAKWKEQNPPPDKEKNPEDYAKWEKRLAERGTESRRSNEASYNQFLKEQEEKRQGMSREEFMRRYAELLQLRTTADQIRMNIQKLRASPNQGETLKATLARSEATLNTVEAEITNISAELQLDVTISRDNWKRFILPALVGVAVVAGPMAASANEGIT